MDEYVAPWTGEEEFQEIVHAIEKRGGQRAVSFESLSRPSTSSVIDRQVEAETRSQNSEHSSRTLETQSQTSVEDLDDLKTPPLQTGITDPHVLDAPLEPSSSARMPIPAFVLQRDVPTPTPTPGPSPLMMGETRVAL